MKFTLALLWILSITFCSWAMHDYGVTEGQRMQKEANNLKLQQCQKIIAKSIYE